jgi:hypothetical protein
MERIQLGPFLKTFFCREKQQIYIRRNKKEKRQNLLEKTSWLSISKVIKQSFQQYIQLQYFLAHLDNNYNAGLYAPIL